MNTEILNELINIIASMGGPFYKVVENKNGTITIKNWAEVFTGTFKSIESLLDNIAYDLYLETTKNDTYLDFPPDGYFSNNEARLEMEAEERYFFYN